VIAAMTLLFIIPIICDINKKLHTNLALRLPSIGFYLLVSNHIMRNKIALAEALALSYGCPCLELDLIS
jgi:hypothetical protein